MLMINDYRSRRACIYAGQSHFRMITTSIGNPRSRSAATSETAGSQWGSNAPDYEG